MDEIKTDCIPALRDSKNLKNHEFLARNSIMCRARYMLSPVRLSVTRVDQSRVEVRIMQLSPLSPQSSPIPIVFLRY